MAEKRLNTRIIHKHETEANWLLATNFIPMQGEIIVYDKDSTHAYERIKIGDGVTVVSSLPFVDDTKVDKVSGKGLSTNDYTTAEKNKLSGIATGANKTVVDSSLSSTSTNPVQNKVVNTAISNLNTLVGDTKVSDQITNAIANKADTDHNHDAVYAAKSHGNHVPATETVNNAKFLRNDNTWQIVTPANIGAAASSHGTHVTFATTAPKASGTASAGSATTVSRSDHVHPAPTSITGNAATATKATQDASGNVITSTYATKTELKSVSDLVGDTAVSEQIEAAQIVYVGPTQPTDPNIKVWINTSEEGTGVVPVLPRIATITLAAASWAGSSESYSQVVEINTVTTATKIDLQPTAQQIVNLQSSETTLMIENSGGVVTCYAIGNKPTVDYTMQVLLQEVAYV